MVGITPATRRWETLIMVEHTYTVEADASGLHWRLSVRPSTLGAKMSEMELSIQVLVDLVEEDDSQLSFQFE